MSGHSKWSKIKRDKETKDKQKGNIFSKLSRLITLAVIEGGGITDRESNVKLRLAIEKAKTFNLPKENIERAIEKGIGPDKHKLKEVVYEAFGPAGISLIILATSDNLNRTLSEVRNVVESHAGKLGDQGSVMHLFRKCGLATFKLGEARYSPVPGEATEESVFSFADKVKAFDIDKDEEFYSVYFPYEFLGKVKENLAGLRPVSVEVDFLAQTLVEVYDKDARKKIPVLIEALENLDDVHKVFANYILK